MNFLNIDFILHIIDDLYLLKNKDIGILCYYFGNINFKGEIYFYKVFDTYSGTEKNYALSSLNNYKQFLYLIDNTKKIGTKILCEFSELSYGEKLQVLEGTKKIKGLAKTGIEQLKGKILIQHSKEYEEIRNYLKEISKDIKKIDSFLNFNMNKLQNKNKTEILNMFLNYK